MRTMILAALLTVGFALGCDPTGGDRMDGDGDRMGGDGGRDTATEMAEMMRGMGITNLPRGLAPGDLPEPDSRGARLVARYCSQCHGIPSPSRESAEDWVPTLRRMFARMDRMAGMGGMMGRMPMRMPDVEAPGEEERQAIRAYLQRHALAATGTAELPPGEGRELFSRVCSRCHALPDPGQHAPEEWAAVVERMRGNMEEMEVRPITDEEARGIVAYLREAAVVVESPRSPGVSSLPLAVPRGRIAVSDP